LGEFGATLMLAGKIPGQTQTIPMAIYFAVEAGDMRQAAIWVLIILSLSLSVLTAVNFWTDLQRISPKPNLSQKLESYFPKAASSTTKSTTKQPESGLCLNIFKPLSGFVLDVGFDISPEILGILGASGSGKSMTLRCIAGLETPSSGKIAVNGKVLFDSVQGINVPSKDRRIGF
jgi:molybdate transport system permease protein